MSSITITAGYRTGKRQISSLLENALNREKKILQTALQRTLAKLQDFEKRYNLTSAEFFERYQTGKTDDRNDFVDWAGEYQIFQSINEKIQALEELTIEYH